MSKSEQYFNDTVTKLLKAQNEMKNVIDKISLRMTELENSLKGTTTSSSSDEKKRVSPQLSVSDRDCANYALLKLTTQKMVALIHEGLDDGGQFRPNLGLVININCIVFIMSLLSSKDEHNQTVKNE